MKLIKIPEEIITCPNCKKRIIIDWGYEEPELNFQYFEKCPYCHIQIIIVVKGTLSVNLTSRIE